MTFKHFSLLLATRVVLAMLCLTLLAWFLSQPGYHAATLLFAALAVGLGVEVFRFVERTNLELSRFLDAARYADFNQRFQFEGMGAGFEDLGATFATIMDEFRQHRSEQETELRHLRALVEHVPVPLLSIHADGRLTLWNNRARRLFGVEDVAHSREIAQHGEEFAQVLSEVKPGERRMVTFRTGDVERQLAIAVSQLVIDSRPERLVSLQDIQSELDGMQQQAWQDLVRVLTHEIMNSITPVASLAKTSVTLLEDASRRLADQPGVVAELADITDAITTVSRRSDSLMEFVSSYRRLTRIPAPRHSTFPIDELFAAIERLIDGANEPDGFRLDTQIEPAQLTLHADRGMIEQVLINLLQNATQALAGRRDGCIELRAFLNRQGHVCITATDNGPGIAEELRQKIFVPFYTTRREGSGVGLALSRQIMIAHGGSITVANAPAGGARFTLVF